MQRRKYVEGAKKSGGASIPAVPAKKHSTLMKTRRTCVCPLTNHQHEYGANGDRKSPGVCLCASVFIEEMFCTLKYRLGSLQMLHFSSYSSHLYVISYIKCPFQQVFCCDFICLSCKLLDIKGFCVFS